MTKTDKKIDQLLDRSLALAEKFVDQVGGLSVPETMRGQMQLRIFSKLLDVLVEEEKGE